MPEDLILAQVLVGISALKNKAECDVVLIAAKERRDELQRMQQRPPLRFLTEEEEDALAKGNSDEMIRVNKEKYDYSGVKESDRLMAERWFMAPQPSASTRNAYNQWRVWNVSIGTRGKTNKKYKGDLIFEKATGKSVW